LPSARAPDEKTNSTASSASTPSLTALGLA
jgi:hypothetical protein